jgi:hypothetical protein
MVFLIAIIPALFVFAVGVMSASKFKTRASAIIAALLGVFTGNPTFMAIDLVAVVIAYGLVSVTWSKAGTRAPPPYVQKPVIPPPKLAPAPKVSSLMTSDFLMLGFACLCVLFFFAGGSDWLKNTASPAPPPIQSSQPKVNKPNEVPKTDKVSVQKEAPVRKRAVTVEDCLKIVDDNAMVRCMERAK